MKNWKFDNYPSTITTGILASLIGLTVIGCSSPTNPTAQELPQSQANSAISNAQTENQSPTDENINNKSTAKPQVTLVNSNNKSQDLPLRKGMTYSEARQIILEQGWKPNPNVESNLESTVVKAIFDRGYIEINDCSGTGEAPCRYEFVNQSGELLYVVTAGRDSLLKNWWIDKKANVSAQQNVSSGTIKEGKYWSATTTQGIEVKGNLYRYFDEQAIDPPSLWQPISELKIVARDSITDGKNSWCLSETCPTTGTDRLANKRRPQTESRDLAIDRLTDRIFYSFNEQLNYRKLQPSDEKYIREWNTIRKTVEQEMRTSLSCGGDWRLLEYDDRNNPRSFNSRSLDRITDAIVNTRYPNESEATKKVHWSGIRQSLSISDPCD